MIYKVVKFYLNKIDDKKPMAEREGFEPSIGVNPILP